MAIIIPRPVPRNQKPPPGSIPDLGHEQLSGIMNWWPLTSGRGNKIYDVVGQNDGDFNGISDPSTLDSGWNIGQFGMALKVDGTDDWINCGDSDRFDGLGQLTVSCFWKPGAVADNNGKAIIAKNHSGGLGRQFMLYVGGVSGGISFQVQTGGTGFGGTAYTVNSIKLLDDTDKWYHIAGVYNSITGLLEIYIDGRFDNSVAASGTLNTAVTSGISIGARWGGVSFVNGTIDDARIYSKSLINTEVYNIAFDPYVSYSQDVILIPSPLSEVFTFSYDINASEDLLFSYDIDVSNEVPFSYDIESGSDLLFSYDIGAEKDLSFSYDINFSNDFSFSYDIQARKDFPFSYDILLIQDFSFSYDVEGGSSLPFSYNIDVKNDFSFSYNITDPGALISCDYDTDMIYVHVGLTAVISDSFSSYGAAPKSLTFDGVNLIEADSFLNLVIRHYGISSGVLSTFSTPGSSISGLAWDGIDLISSDLYDNKIYHHDGLSDNINDSFTAPGVAVTGLTHNGTHLFSCDQTLEMAYVHSGITSTITDSFFTENPSDLAYYNIEN